MKDTHFSKHSVISSNSYIHLIFRILTYSSLILLITEQLFASSAPPPITGPFPTSIAISSDSNTLLKLGESFQLTVNATLSDGTIEDITSSETGVEYESNDPSIVTVDSEGLVTAVDIGTATIVASTGIVLDEIKIQVLNPLNENCIASALNRQATVNTDGTYAFGNIPLPDGAFRVRVVCDRKITVEFAQSQLLTGVPNGTFEVGELTFGVQAPIPLSLNLATTAGTLTPTVLTAQITTTGNLTGGATVDLTPSSTGTFYATSNPAFATVTQEGLVTAVASGTVFITAQNEGVVATIPIQVVLSDDTDGDEAVG